MDRDTCDHQWKTDCSYGPPFCWKCGASKDASPPPDPITRILTDRERQLYETGWRDGAAQARNAPAQPRCIDCGAAVSDGDFDLCKPCEAKDSAGLKPQPAPAQPGERMSEAVFDVTWDYAFDHGLRWSCDLAREARRARAAEKAEHEAFVLSGRRAALAEAEVQRLQERVRELEGALAVVLPYAESRAEDLDEGAREAEWNAKMYRPGFAEEARADAKTAATAVRRAYATLRREAEDRT